MRSQGKFHLPVNWVHTEEAEAEEVGGDSHLRFTMAPSTTAAPPQNTGFLSG
mgnify:FL=1